MRRTPFLWQSLSLTFIDPVGTRFQIETGREPDDGERALYHKGKSIVLRFWADAHPHDIRHCSEQDYDAATWKKMIRYNYNLVSSQDYNAALFKQIEDEWLPKFENEKDVKIVLERSEKIGEKDHVYFMIGDIRKGIDLLRSNTEFGISSRVADALLKEMDVAEARKAKMDEEHSLSRSKGTKENRARKRRKENGDSAGEKN